MSGEAIAVIIAAVITGAAAIVAAVIQHRVRKEVRGMRADVEPISNGYAADTRAALSRIETEQQRQGQQLAETRQDVGGLRSEMRGVRRETEALRQADRDLHQRIYQLHPPTGGNTS